MKFTKSLILIAICLLGINSSAHAASKLYNLKKSELTKVSIGKSKALCGLTGSKWSAVKKVGSKYAIDTSSSANTTNRPSRQGVVPNRVQARALTLKIMT